uniref:Uncharacterized protein n=1 Tax=viral metagenome TaxID=1070528 RepID=A0A6C0CVA9_9ZZZZ
MKQLRKSKSMSKKKSRTKSRTKSTKTKTNRTKSRRNKRMTGGKPEISLGITYDTIFEYLIELLNRPDFKTKVFDKNKTFIHSISINNDNISESFNFSNNAEFRKFIDDLIQWLLLDYNPYIFNSLLTIIYNCFDNPKFLDDDADSFEILFDNLQNMILQKMDENFNTVDDDKKNEINLLILILYLLTIPSVTTAVSNFINNNKVVFQNNLSDIKCVINNIKKINIKNNTMVRKLLSNYFESLKIDSSTINVTELVKLLGKFGDCIPRLLLHITGNIVTSTGKSIGQSVSQSFGKHIVSPAQSLYSRIPKFQIPNILPK